MHPRKKVKLVKHDPIEECDGIDVKLPIKKVSHKRNKKEQTNGFEPVLQGPRSSD